MKLIVCFLFFMSIVFNVLETAGSYIGRIATPINKRMPQKKKEEISYYQKIKNDIDDLEKRYVQITEEFTRLADYQREHGDFASKEERERFNELIQEADEIFEKKRKLNEQLEIIRQGPGGFAFQEPENAPYGKLYQASAGGFLELGMAKAKKQSEIQNKEKLLKKLLAEYKSLKIKRNLMTPEKTPIEEFSLINRTLNDLDKEMLKLVYDDPNTPEYIVELFKRERFPESIPSHTEPQKTKQGLKEKSLDKLTREKLELRPLKEIKSLMENGNLTESSKKALPLENELEPLQVPRQILQKKKVSENELKKTLRQLHTALMNISMKL